MNYRHQFLSVLLAAVGCSSVALGGGSAYWVELDNSVQPITGSPTGLDDGAYDGTVYRTFDLYVELPPAWDTGDPADNLVTAIYFGIIGPNAGLAYDGAVFQSELGSDRVARNEQVFGFIEQLYFDIAIAIEDAELPQVAVSWGPELFKGSWNPGIDPGPVAPAADGTCFIMRVTISADATVLGGECLVIDRRLEPPCDHPLCDPIPDPSLYVHTIPNAFQELECLGDINWDGVIDTADLGRLIRSFGEGWGDEAFNPRADFTRDGVVDTADLGRLIARFGQTCE